MTLPYDQLRCVSVMLLVRRWECVEDPQRSILDW
jgi:hypothetical protein